MDNDKEYEISQLYEALVDNSIRCKRTHRSVLFQCFTHEDSKPSAEVFEDGWVKCYAGCKGYRIEKFLPELKGGDRIEDRPDLRKKIQQTFDPSKYADQYEYWERLPKIPRDHEFKGIPLEVLDELGWRYDRYRKAYYIPYWGLNRETIPFGQWRHLEGSRRFSFTPGVTPIIYGLWQLKNAKYIFIVEGASDMATLRYAGVNAVGMPSASSGALIEKLAAYCAKNGIRIIYAGDRDDAGEKLKEHLTRFTYEVKQCADGYKDWGEMFEAEGIDKVIEHIKGPRTKHVNPIDTWARLFEKRNKQVFAYLSKLRDGVE